MTDTEKTGEFIPDLEDELFPRESDKSSVSHYRKTEETVSLS